MKALHKVSLFLALFGAVNWGLEVFNLNLVSQTFGRWPAIADLIYLLIAAAGVNVILNYGQYMGTTKQSKTAKSRR